MIDWLTAALLVAAISQPTMDRFYPVAIFALLTETHGVLLGDLDGIAYYGSAAAFDLAIISGTAMLPVIPRVTIDIHRISIISLALNGIGWVFWMLYFPPAAYDAAFILLYSWALGLLLRRDRADGWGFFSMDNWRFDFRRYSSAGNFNHTNHKGGI